MMKVLGIGLSRTGITSLTLALSELGLHAYHFPNSREVIDSVDAATGTPVAAWYQEFDVAYPDSMFILTLRHLPDWLDSCEALWQSSSRYFDEFTCAIHRRLYGREDFDRDAFASAYIRHVAGVIDYFTGRDEDLLLLDICSGQEWEQLCPFLGLARPVTPFPHRNRRGLIGRDWVQSCPPHASSPVHSVLPFPHETEAGSRLAG